MLLFLVLEMRLVLTLELPTGFRSSYLSGFRLSLGQFILILQGLKISQYASIDLNTIIKYYPRFDANATYYAHQRHHNYGFTINLNLTLLGNVNLMSFLIGS